MKTQMSKASKGYTLAESDLDVNKSCFALLRVLWRLDIIKYVGYDSIRKDEEAWHHQRSLVDMWSNLYIEQQFMGRKKR